MGLTGEEFEVDFSGRRDLQLVWILVCHRFIRYDR